MFQRSLLRVGRNAFRSAPSARLMAVPMVYRAFSAQVPRFKSALNAADAQLAEALQKEIEFENVAVSNGEIGDNQEWNKFIADSGFQVIEKDGIDIVELVKKNGGETIHVFFSVSDVTNADFESNTFEEEDEDGNSELSESMKEEMSGDAPLRLNIVVEKPSGKALSFEALCQDEMLLVENIVPYETSELALNEAAEVDYKRQALYRGPAFVMLEEDVQKAVDAYLESRGIDNDFGQFVYNYSLNRENTQYIGWLKRLNEIVKE